MLQNQVVPTLKSRIAPKDGIVVIVVSAAFLYFNLIKLPEKMVNFRTVVEMMRDAGLDSLVVHERVRFDLIAFAVAGVLPPEDDEEKGLTGSQNSMDFAHGTSCIIHNSVV